MSLNIGELPIDDDLWVCVMTESQTHQIQRVIGPMSLDEALEFRNHKTKTGNYGFGWTVSRLMSVTEWNRWAPVH